MDCRLHQTITVYVAHRGQLFLEDALIKGHLRDRIVDEHALLLYVKHTAERQKRNHRGKEIVGTRVGAVCNQHSSAGIQVKCMVLTHITLVANQERIFRCTSYP